MPNLESIKTWFMELQDNICQSLEQLDGQAKFQQDLWERPAGGGGRTRVIANGGLLEKGGVNFSYVHGKVSAPMLRSLELPAVPIPSEFHATGVSIVLHPQSPMVPIIHMNVRYFEMDSGVWWFGGGIDLTPHYVTPNLAKDFHQGLKNVCDKHSPFYYPKFKEWADNYFFLPHRNETRGIGGIFFDRLDNTGGENRTYTKEERFAFTKDVGNAFIPLYTHQANATRALDYSQNELDWQGLRRGRYVEFNLVWDRGTKFGIHTGGRTESILMSLPYRANWVYNYQAEKDSHEAKTLNSLKKGIDWINA